MIYRKTDNIRCCIGESTQYSDRGGSEKHHEFESKKPILESVYKDKKYKKR